MRPMLLVVRRELLERLGTRSFRLFTAGLFLLAAGGIIAVDQASAVFGESEYEVGIVTQQPGLDEALDRFAANQDVSVDTRQVEDRSEAEQLLRDGEIDAFLSEQQLVYESGEIPRLTTIVNQALYAARLPELLQEAGITQEEAGPLLEPEPVQTVQLDPGGDDEVDRRFIGFLAALGLYVTLAVYGNWILTGVVEEKSSRIVEVLLGLLRPHELLAGKTMGIVLVAIGQLLAAVLGALTGVLVAGSDILPTVALDVVIASVPLYIMGVVLYSLVYAAVGATVTRQADAQAAATPIVTALLVPYMFAAIFVPENPDGLASTVLSVVPFTSPLVMPTRVATGSPATVELVACYALLVPAILATAWLGGRVYSSAIMSGRSISILGLLKSILKPQREAGPSNPS